MRGVAQRTPVAAPGVPCLACSDRINLLDMPLEMNGDLDDPEYIKRAGRESGSGPPTARRRAPG